MVESETTCPGGPKKPSTALTARNTALNTRVNALLIVPPNATVFADVVLLTCLFEAASKSTIDAANVKRYVVPPLTTMNSALKANSVAVVACDTVRTLVLPNLAIVAAMLLAMDLDELACEVDSTPDSVFDACLVEAPANGSNDAATENR